MRHEEIDYMLRPLAPVLSSQADAILDLRELLITQGHPGKCVRCFFRLFEAAGANHKPQLAPLKAWLERNVEISVQTDSRELEILPLVLANGDLESFCLKSMEKIRMDRGYRPLNLRLAFRYKTAA